MREKHKKLYGYARLVVKPVGLIFTLVAIALVGAQILLAVEGTVGKGWLVLFFVGFALWLLDSMWSTLEDWDKLRKQFRETQRPTK